MGVSSGTGLPGSRGPKAIKRLCVCVTDRGYRPRIINAKYQNKYWVRTTLK